MQSVLLVEDDAAIRNLIARWLRDLGCRPIPARHGLEALHLLTEHQIDLVITDLRMPILDGLGFLRLLHEMPSHPPAIIITGFGDVSTAVQAMKLGAIDFLEKPIDVTHFNETVRAALSATTGHLDSPLLAGRPLYVDESITDLLSQVRLSEPSDSLLEALGEAIDAREKATGDHSKRVRKLAVTLGAQCGLGRDLLAHLSRGALLHDIGKIGISDEVLLKPGSLTAEEWMEMRLHPEIGDRIVSKVEFLRPARAVILCHHERFDGTGYPHGLRGEGINLLARVFSVADSVDAMLSNRPYQLAKSLDGVLAELSTCAGNQLDPEIVRAFTNLPLETWAPIYGQASSKSAERRDDARAASAT